MKKLEIPFDDKNTLELGNIPKVFWPSAVASYLVTRAKYGPYAIINLKTNKTIWFDLRNETHM